MIMLLLLVGGYMVTELIALSENLNDLLTGEDRDMDIDLAMERDGEGGSSVNGS